MYMIEFRDLDKTVSMELLIVLYVHTLKLYYKGVHGHMLQLNNEGHIDKGRHYTLKSRDQYS